ncbi:alpha/beta fold hydrolase [Paenalkalicoccus suaedae]|uniref:Alpha/beta fold hydrolase n=1 Tax=Paenalkalicoccus suaedae TaxID=2592382 RepID=A0A859FIU5_9BACI|nr:alpha/beta fold hydrolase [Paenalkalicoccus suaedae]QKS72236.1 alpha/beta fold hydrolase [Paenalkalicoccus suaedae]
MIGCLFVHGFTSNPKEVNELVKHLEDKSWMVYCPELPGHDGTKESLKQFSYKHWVYKTEVALEELLKRCDTVYVIGFSMGGVIAGYLAAKYPVTKLVLISSAVYYLNPKQIAQDATGWFMEGIRGELEENELYHFYLDKVKRTPVSATIEFAKLVRKLRHALDDIDVPTLIVQGESDGLVPPKSADYIYSHIQSEDKQIFYFPNAKHYIWFGEEKQELIDKIDEFLDSTTARKERDVDDEDRTTETVYH